MLHDKKLSKMCRVLFQKLKKIYIKKMGITTNRNNIGITVLYRRRTVLYLVQFSLNLYARL